MTRRQRNLIQKLATGTVLYTTGANRITTEEARLLGDIDDRFALQRSRPIHEGAHFYPLNSRAFRQAARELGIVE